MFRVTINNNIHLSSSDLDGLCKRIHAVAVHMDTCDVVPASKWLWVDISHDPSMDRTIVSATSGPDGCHHFSYDGERRRVIASDKIANYEIPPHMNDFSSIMKAAINHGKYMHLPYVRAGGLVLKTGYRRF